MTAYLLLRELLVLFVAVSFGAGVTALIPKTERHVSRLALAPAAGVAVGSGILLTVNLIVPLRHAFWFVVIPAAIVSALLVRRSGLRPPRLGELARIGLVLVIALGAGSYVLVKRDSPGPIGYGIFDGPGYITPANGFESHTSSQPLLSIHANEEWMTDAHDDIDWGAPWDLSQRYGWGYRWQHTASNTINAVASGATGWQPWTVVGALIVAMLAAGALGCYALAGALGAGPVARTLAGIAYAGPLVYMIFADGSEGLTAGLAVVPAVIITTMLAFERPGVRSAAVAGAMIGGLQAVYPEIAPTIVGGLILAALVRFGLPVLRRRAPAASLLPVLRVLPVAVGVAILVGLRAVPWTWQYLVNDRYSGFKANLVPYNMAVEYIPGWLYQTREFYQFAFAHPSGSEQTLVGVILPLALMAVSAAAFVLSSRARWLGGIVAAVVLQAFWSSRSLDCSYCVQRSLLILGPLLPALLLTGASLLMARGGRVRDGVLVLGGIAAVAFASTAVASQQRVREGATVAPRALQDAVDTAAALDQTTLLEGAGTTPFSAWLYEPTALAALSRRVPRVSVVPSYNEWGGLSYLATRPEDHPAWTPDYETVMTRFGALQTPGRTRVADHAPYFVAKRAHPFDVTIAGGVATDAHDPGGLPYVQSPGTQLGLTQGPLRFWIAADDERTSYLRFRLVGPQGLAVKDVEGLTGVVTSQPDATALDVCAEVRGTAPTRRVALVVDPPSGPLGAPLRRYENAPAPAKTTWLSSMAATTKPCK